VNHFPLKRACTLQW